MVLGQGIQLLLPRRKFSLEVPVFDLETRCGQSLDIVATVDAAVVILPEYARALVGVGDGVILDGVFALQIHGRQYYGPTSGTQYAENFA